MKKTSFVLIFSIVTTLYACITEAPKASVAAGSDAPKTCPELLEIKARIVKTLASAAKIAENKDGITSFVSPSILKSGDFSEEGIAKELGFRDYDQVGCELVPLLNNPSSDLRLVAQSYSTDGMISGMVVYQGDLFTEGFYRTRNSPGEKGKKRLFGRPPYDDLISLRDRQPWLERTSSGEYIYHNQGASKRILEHLFKGKESFTLYRGTNPSYLTPSAIMTIPPNDDSDFGDIGGVFTTPTLDAAKIWARHTVIEFTLTKAQMDILNNDLNPFIYAGIEAEVGPSSPYSTYGGYSKDPRYAYVELAFPLDPTNPVIEEVIGTAKSHCDIPLTEAKKVPFWEEVICITSQANHAARQ